MPSTEEKKGIEQLKSCVSKETSDIIEICRKLSQLEKKWHEIFSKEAAAIANGTAPGECKVETDGITIKIYAASKSIITALKFKEKIFRADIEKFTGAKIKKIEFACGRVKRISAAKDASKAFERYAPVTVLEDSIKKEKEKFLPFTEDEKLAEIIAKTKLMADKKAKRH